MAGLFALPAKKQRFFAIPGLARRPTWPTFALPEGFPGTPITQSSNNGN
jgi:hypothetical protein